MDKSRYFFRTVVYAKRGKQVTLVDLHNPREDTPVLEPWLSLVINLADGRHTIQQLIDFMKSKYAESVPENLEQTIESVLTRLTKADAIRLSERAVDLPYYLAMPAEKLDIELAKKMMAEDNFRQGSA